MFPAQGLWSYGVAKRNKPRREDVEDVWDVRKRLQREAEAADEELFEVDYSITPENILEHIAALAFFDPRNLQTQSGNLRPLHKLDKKTAIGLAGVDVGPGGVVKYRYVSRVEVLKLLMEYKKLLMGGGALDEQFASDARDILLRAAARAARRNEPPGEGESGP